MHKALMIGFFLVTLHAANIHMQFALLVSAPSDLVIAPKWGLKSYEIKALIEQGING